MLFVVLARFHISFRISGGQLGFCVRFFSRFSWFVVFVS